MWNNGSSRRTSKKGHISLDTFEDDELKFARMATSKLPESIWLVSMHYLVGKNGEIGYFTEVHKMLSLDCVDYVRAFKSSGLRDTRFLTQNLWDGCRGLFTARR